MPKLNRTQGLVITLALTVIGAVVFFFTQTKEKRPPPSEGGYYSGPMKGKGARVTYGDDNGREVAPPASTAAVTPPKTQHAAGPAD